MPESQQRQFVRKAASAKGPYGDIPAVQGDHSLLRIEVLGDADPNLPSRILDILTIRGDLPLEFGCSKDVASGTVTIRIEVLADEVAFPALLMDRILKIPTVISAALVSPSQA